MALIPLVLLILALNITSLGQNTPSCPLTVGESFQESNGYMNVTLNTLLITGYEFHCSGAVIAWEFTATHRGNVTVFVAKRSTDNSYLIRGVNKFFVPFSGSLYFPVHSEERISFEKGDIIGVVSDNPGLLSEVSNAETGILQMHWEKADFASGISMLNATFPVRGKIAVMAVIRGLQSSSFTFNDQESDAVFNQEAKHCSFSDSIMGMPFNSWGLPQLIAIRFFGAQISRTTELYSFHIQFTSARARDGEASVAVKVYNDVKPTDDVVKQCQFQDTSKLSSMGITWNIPRWGAGENSATQRTPNLVDLLKNLTRTEGWEKGNDIVFVFVPLSTSGTREPYSSSAPGREPKATLILIDKVVGEWQTWTSWSRCLEAGNDGLMHRRRTCKDRDDLGWCPGKSYEMRSCNISAVLRWAEWSSWSSCSVTCRHGYAVRNRTCAYYGDVVDSMKCGHENTTSYQICETNIPCPVYNWTAWSSWGPCSVTCKNGTTMRHRNCTTNGTNVNYSYCKDGNWMDYKKCIRDDYCVDERGYNPWEPWSACSSTVCPEGKRLRQRFCVNQTYCDRDLREIQVCPPEPCPVHGAWGIWQPWLACSTTCGGGRRMRYRFCDNPTPLYNGNPCPGPNVTQVSCSENLCPVHGGFSDWTSWSYCNQPCDTGESRITRKCNNPTPNYGGKPCDGPAVISKKCNFHGCLETTLDMTIYLKQGVAVQETEISGSEKFNGLEQEIAASIQKLYFNSSNWTPDILLKQVRAKEQEAIVRLRYSAISSIQFLLLQHGLQRGLIMSSLVASYYNAISEKVPLPPTQLITSATGSTSISCAWTNVEPPPNKLPIEGYIIFYLKTAYTTAQWDWKAVTKDNMTTDIIDLDSYSTYAIRVAAFVRFGVGVPSDLVYERTLDGVPSSAPKNFTCKVWSSKEVLLQWVEIDDTDWNGFMEAYVLRYKVYNGRDWKIDRIKASESSVAVESLNSFTTYEFHIAAMTKAGAGPNNSVVCKTQEDVPSTGPPDLRGVNRLSATYITFSWSPIPADQVHGELLGYIIAWGVSRLESRREESPMFKTKTVDPYTFDMKIDGLLPNSEITVKAYGYTIVGYGKPSTIVLNTCNCISPIYVAWAQDKPYVDVDVISGRLGGIFPSFVKEMLQTVCGPCKGYGENQVNGSVLVYMDRLKDGSSSQRKSPEDLENGISDEAHVHMPVFGKIESSSYLSSFHFIRVVQNQGFAMVVYDESKRPQLGVIIASIFALWPVASLGFCMALLAGILVFLTDKNSNPEFSQGNFCKGAMTGLWWSFVTMTTVGYGDITPKSAVARILGIAWIQAGLILSGMIISVIASSLTLVSIPNDPLLYGSKVAVINGSKEYYLALRRNADVMTYGISTPKDQLQFVAKDLSEIALVDVISTTKYATEITNTNLKVSKLIEDLSGYGIVLTSDLVYIKENVLQYCQNRRVYLQEELEKYTGKIEIPIVDKSKKSDLFNYKSDMFRNMAITLSVLLLAFLGLGRYYEKTIEQVWERQLAEYKKLEVFAHHFEASYAMERTYRRFTMRVLKKFNELDKKHDQQVRKLQDQKTFHKIFVFRLIQNFLNRKIKPIRLDSIRPTSSQIIRELQSAEIQQVSRGKKYQMKTMSSVN